MRTGQLPGPGRAAVAAVMLLLWLGLGVFSAAPELHQLLHKDSQSATHNCCITQFSQSSILSGDCGLGVASPLSVWVWNQPGYQFPDYPSSDKRLAPGRAPPAFIPIASVVG